MDFITTVKKMGNEIIEMDISGVEFISREEFEFYKYFLFKMRDSLKVKDFEKFEEENWRFLITSMRSVLSHYTREEKFQYMILVLDNFERNYDCVVSNILDTNHDLIGDIDEAISYRHITDLKVSLNLTKTPKIKASVEGVEIRDEEFFFKLLNFANDVFYSLNTIGFLEDKKKELIYLISEKCNSDEYSDIKDYFLKQSKEIIKQDKEDMVKISKESCEYFRKYLNNLLDF